MSLVLNEGVKEVTDNSDKSPRIVSLSGISTSPTTIRPKSCGTLWSPPDSRGRRDLVGRHGAVPSGEVTVVDALPHTTNKITKNIGQGKGHPSVGRVFQRCTPGDLSGLDSSEPENGV